MTESNPMEDGNCVLLGSDKSAGTMPVYISSITNTLISYCVGGLLSIILLVAIVYTLKIVPNISKNENFRFFLSNSSLVTFIVSVVFYLNAGYDPNIIFFSIMGIIFSCIAMYLFMDGKILELLIQGILYIIVSIKNILTKVKSCFNVKECRKNVISYAWSSIPNGVVAIIGWIFYITATQ
jgi:hypothetical protein